MDEPKDGEVPPMTGSDAETCAVPECDREAADQAAMDWRDGEPVPMLLCNPCANAYRLGIRAERETVDMP